MLNKIIDFFWVVSLIMTVLSVPSMLLAWLIDGNFYEATRGANFLQLGIIYGYFILSTIYMIVRKG